MANSKTEPSVGRIKNLGALQELLLKACPPDTNNNISIPVLARALGVSSQYVYLWIERDKVPPAYAKKMADFPGSQVTLEMFTQYVFK